MAALGTKAIIFDCFGVLYVDHKQSLLAEVPVDRRQELADVFMRNNYGYLDRKTYLSQVADITGMSAEDVTAYMAQEHRLNQPLVTLISEQLRPEYKVGLLSNIGREWIHDFFSKHQLHDLFDEVVLSGEEGMTKPLPAIFELMAARLGLNESECLMIDDIAENCEGAEIAGMQAIHFTSNEQLFDRLYEQKIIV